jgi:hypothetical protein
MIVAQAHARRRPAQLREARRRQGLRHHHLDRRGLTTGVGTSWSTPRPRRRSPTSTRARQEGLRQLRHAPDTMVLPWKDYKNLRNCAQIIDKIKYSGRDDPKNVTAQMLAAIFDIEQVLVADAQYNSANEGQAASPRPSGHRQRDALQGRQDQRPARAVHRPHVPLHQADGSSDRRHRRAVPRGKGPRRRLPRAATRPARR